MFDEDIMLTGSECFLGLPWPLLTDAKNAKDTDIGDDFIGDTNVRGIGTRSVCTEGIGIGDTYIKDAYIKNICLRSAGIEVICIRDVYTSDSCAKDTCAENVSFTVIAYIKGAGPKSICGSAYKSSESFVKGLGLLVGSIFKMSISSCLHLQVILDSFL